MTREEIDLRLKVKFEMLESLKDEIYDLIRESVELRKIEEKKHITERPDYYMKLETHLFDKRILMGVIYKNGSIFEERPIMISL